MKTCLTLICSCLLLLSASVCQADVTNYFSGSSYTTTQTKIGQSWTADSTGTVKSITLNFQSSTATTFTLYVRSGSTASGNYLIMQTVTLSGTGVQTIDLNGSVNVASGSTYNFYLVNTTTPVNLLYSSGSDTYAGGTLILNGVASSSSDLYFGIIMASDTPAATPWQYGLIALLLAAGTFVILRKRSRS